MPSENVTELSEEHIDQIFKNGFRLGLCELVMDDSVAECLGKMRNGGKNFMKHAEKVALREWRKQGRPCSTDAARDAAIKASTRVPNDHRAETCER